MLLAIAFLLLVSLAFSALISSLQSLRSAAASEFVFAWQVVYSAIGLIMVASLFALMFKILPRVSVAWTDVLIGAGFTALLFTFNKYVISLYQHDRRHFQIRSCGLSDSYPAVG
jgi:membrane protein